ncbi:MAG: NrfD/PsrC family molybdoenzyme membrane anchor subunit [Dehalococcoides mccartyi]|uniref:NrfD/PsrC family molybdoenzyme membrane anchor subunit n=1 Tax=Dehalococcoides mccartyi TaxID=61435 RepID=UPI0025C7653A|nr:NrfD/PsrC family molybdoenzyme membrane anchor subunit [Dehalococcoides mccartyi]MDN4186152.1 polysulfide reductase NrfD [Dehalococcoides mccartyi]
MFSAIKGWVNKLEQTGNPNVPLFGKWGLLQIILALGALTVAGLKLAYGLGPITNLSDNWPWGLWVAFDVGAYIASAAGGFTMAAIVYIFGFEKFRPLVRPAILIGALCYTIGAIGIMIDLARSIRIVHPIWMWNHESIMFEVGWCVMMYLTVLYLEFSNNIFERIGWKKLGNLQHAFIIPLVIFGIMLSFLHQSSLGALFLINPAQQPLWHGPLMGHLFLVSAMALGLSVLTYFSIILSRSWKMTLRMDILSKLGLVIAWILLVYLAARGVDYAITGNLAAGLNGDWYTVLWVAEVGIGMLLPMILLFIKKVRTSRTGLLWSTGLIIMGVVLNRINTLVISQAPNREGSYFPHILEFVFTFGLIAGAMYVFRLCAKYLPLYSDHMKGLTPEQVKKAPEVIPAS